LELSGFFDDERSPLELLESELFDSELFDSDLEPESELFESEPEDELSFEPESDDELESARSPLAALPPLP